MKFCIKERNNNDLQNMKFLHAIEFLLTKI